MRSHPLVIRACAGAALGALVAGLAAAPVQAAETLAPRTTFVMQADGSSGLTKSGEGIPNIDSVTATIRTYYKASEAGVADKKSSPYITEIGKLLAAQNSYLAQSAGTVTNPAIVLDVDDTLLWNYDLEDGALHFDYDPVVQDEWVQGQKFPAVPGLAAFVDKAVTQGYAVFAVTGRSSGQEAATLGNLTKVGFGATFTADNVFTRPAVVPDYVTCATASCTTVEFKAGTRAYLESAAGGSHTVVLNIGDQWSDLKGGHAARTLKLPNPMYYLPSPDLTGLPEPTMVPRTKFEMEADGSSGKTVGGEAIPNFDSVANTIRAYYNATNGIADKKQSRFITQLKKLRDTWSTRLTNRCTRQRALGNKPAVVFDVDDTTLWTYDLKDAGMSFGSNRALQDEWVLGRKFPAVPAMKRVVRAAKRHGCVVVGITARRADKRQATLQNLRRHYGDAFRSTYFFTRWADGRKPAYISCAKSCSTTQFKSQTRAHLERKGLTILANFGDQYSDLIGGHGRPVKVPNPTQYSP